MSDAPWGSPDEVQAALRAQAYLADRGLATAIHLALALDKPLLLEGEAGVGKTEVAKVLAPALKRKLIRLQCYEGIDASQALYEWDYSRQLVAARAPEFHVDAVKDLFGHPLGHLRQPSTHDLDLAGQTGMVDPVIEAAAL